jgi:TolA-binding protein
VTAPPKADLLAPPKADLPPRPKRRFLGSVAVLLISAAAFAPVAFGSPVDDLLSVGKKAFADAQYALAVSSLQRIQDEYPESPRAEEAGYLLGVSLFYLGKWTDCLSAFDSLLGGHPDTAYAARSAYWVGAANLKLGNYQAALDNLRASVQESGAAGGAGAAGPYRLSAMLYSSIALEGLGRDAEAAAGYREILLDASAQSLAAEVSYRLAGTELRAGRYGEARDLYGKVLLQRVGSPFVRDAVFFAGECELFLGNAAEAEKRYRTVLSLYPDSPYTEAATFRLADAAWRQKRPSAFRLLEDFLGRFPGGAYTGSAHRLRGEILAEQKKPSAALEEYGKAVSILPEGGEKQSAYYAMARVQLALGRRLDAAESYAHAGTGPSSGIAEKASYQRALLLAGEGKAPEAIQALRSFLELFPSSARAEEAGRLLGKLLDRQGDRESSRTLWDSLARTYPGSPAAAEYLYSRGIGLLARGQWAPALDDFQGILKGHAGSAWDDRSAYAIGYVYAQRGEYPRALPFFRSDRESIGGFAAAICLFNMGRFDEAAAAFRSFQASATAVSSEGTVELYIGRSLYRMGRLEDAAVSLARAAEKLQTEGSTLGADAHYWRGWALLRLRRPAQAYAAFMALAEGYPGDIRNREALFRAAVCQTMQSADAAAIALYERVIGGDSAPPKADLSAPPQIIEQAMYERAMALARLGRAQESMGALEQLARAFPSGRLAAQALFSRAEKARAEKRFSDAHADFSRVASDFPRSALAGQASYWSAQSLLEKGDTVAALEAFWACLVLPVSGGLLQTAAQGFRSALRDLGDLEKARQYALKAASTPNLSPDAEAAVALAAADMLLPSSPEEARALIDAVTSAAPPEPYAGEAGLLLGKYAAARSDWGRALDIFGALEGSRADDVGARAALEKGRALEAMGRTADAVDEYLKVSYLYPDLGDRAAEGMVNAVRLSRLRGDRDRAAKILQSLRKTYPASPWIATLSVD